jgi:hypothetical protein
MRKIQDKKVPFVAISADRNEFSRKGNDERYKELKSLVKAAGFPFIETEGSWVEHRRG